MTGSGHQQAGTITVITGAARDRYGCEERRVWEQRPESERAMFEPRFILGVRMRREHLFILFIYYSRSVFGTTIPFVVFC